MALAACLLVMWETGSTAFTVIVPPGLLITSLSQNRPINSGAVAGEVLLSMRGDYQTLAAIVRGIFCAAFRRLVLRCKPQNDAGSPIQIGQG
jgi:hypothetical protein